MKNTSNLPRQIVVGFLPWWPQNPYQILLKQQLNALGVRVVGNPHRSILRLLFNRDGLDVLHIHWPQDFYEKRPWRFPLIMAVLWLYRLVHHNVVWTIHELEVYSTRRRLLNRLSILILSKICRAYFVHSNSSATELRSRCSVTTWIVPIRHPSYVGYYKDDVDRAAARARLGLSEEQRVILFFGHIKPYKGVEELIRAFRALPGTNSALVVAGAPLDRDIQRRVTELAESDTRIRLNLRFINSDEVQYFFNAADAVVFPFRQIHTSGSIMLAMTFGKPIVAPALKPVLEYVSEPAAILFDPMTPDGLLQALEKAAHCDLADMGRIARAQGGRTSWAEMARIHAKVYGSVISGQFPPYQKWTD